MVLLTTADIIYINGKTIEAHGGNFVPPQNLLHGENLAYLVEIVDAELFGEPLYPTVADKAAVYFHHIICNHIFTDGNKRMGLESALSFLKINNYRLNKGLPLRELYDFTIATANGEMDLASCQNWFAAQLVSL